MESKATLKSIPGLSLLIIDVNVLAYLFINNENKILIVIEEMTKSTR